MVDFTLLLQYTLVLVAVLTLAHAIFSDNNKKK